MATLKDSVLKFYLEQDYNCAESLSRGANEYYQLGLNEDALLALGGFGGGCYSGRMCGACSGSVAAISSKYIHTRAHAEDLACSRVNEFVNAFVELFGTEMCEEIKKVHYKEELGTCCCRETVEMAAELLDQKMSKFMAEDEAMAKAE